MGDDDKKKRSSTETARRIWLAGIGAYGRAFTEAQGALKEVTGKSSDVFDDLVQKGEMIEKVVEYKGREILDKTKMGDIDVPSLDIDERIKRMRARLSMGTAPQSTDMESVETRLQALEAEVSSLSDRVKLLEQQSLPKPKTSTRKAVTKTKAKTQRTSKTSKS